MAATNGASTTPAATATNSTNSPGRTGSRARSSRREQAALGVDLLDELAGDADGVLDERGVLLDGRVEVDVLLAAGQVEDVGELLLALVDAGEQPDDEQGQAAAHEQHREHDRLTISAALAVGDLAGVGHARPCGLARRAARRPGPPARAP